MSIVSRQHGASEKDHRPNRKVILRAAGTRTAALVACLTLPIDYFLALARFCATDAWYSMLSETEKPADICPIDTFIISRTACVFMLIDNLGVPVFCCPLICREYLRCVDVALYMRLRYRPLLLTKHRSTHFIHQNQQDSVGYRPCLLTALLAS